MMGLAIVTMLLLSLLVHLFQMVMITDDPDDHDL